MSTVEPPPEQTAPKTEHIPAVWPNFPAPIFCVACKKEITARHPGFFQENCFHVECPK